jgi:hypothetical protein
LNNIQKLADDDLAKFTLYGRLAKLLIIFDPAVVAGLKSSAVNKQQEEDPNILGYMSEVLAALGTAQKIANVDEK